MSSGWIFWNARVYVDSNQLGPSPLLLTVIILTAILLFLLLTALAYYFAKRRRASKASVATVLAA